MTDTKPTTRRSFLRASVAATGAAGLIARSAHAAGNETIRIGLIGCGGRGTDAAAQSMQAGPYVKLVAMCDVFQDRLQNSLNTLQQRFPEQVKVDGDHCFVGLEGYGKVIESADLVLIACASKFHPMYSGAAIRAGKHVFVEKPHGIDPVGVRQMKQVCDLARTKGLNLVSGLHSRFDNGWEETVKRIHDGAIGDIVAMQCMFLRAPYAVVNRDSNLTELQYHFRNWYHFCWLSGDDVTQSLVHNIDRAAWILKEETPVSAFGLAGRSASFGEQYGDMFDHHTVVYEYASGVRVYALCRTQHKTHHNYNDIIMGTKGTCNLGECRIQAEHGWRFEGKRINAHAAEQKSLIRAIRNGEPINSGDYMCNSTMAAVLGQIVCYEGIPHTWQGAWKSDFSFGPLPEKVTMDIEPPTRPDKTGNYPLPTPGVARMLG